MDFDTTAADMLLHLVAELDAQGIHMVIARASAPLGAMLRLTGLIGHIGDDRFFPLLGNAIAAFHTRPHCHSHAELMTS